VLRGDVGEAPAELFAAGVGGLDELFVAEDGEDGPGCGRGEGVSAEGRAVGSGREGDVELSRRRRAPMGKPPPEAFCQGDRVAVDAVVLSAEPPPGSAHARLDLIDEEERPVIVGELPEPRQKPGRRREDAPFAEHRLNEDRGHVGAHGGGGRLEIAVVDVRHAWQGRPEALAVFRVPGDGDGPEGAAVERVFERDDAVAVRLALGEEVAAGELDHRLVGLGAGVAEEGPVKAGHRAELLGEAQVLGVVEVVRDVHEPPRLLGDGRDEAGMSVPERRDGHARGEVEVAAALGVEELGAFSSVKDKGSLAVIAEKTLLAGSEEGLGGLGGPSDRALGRGHSDAHGRDLRRKAAAGNVACPRRPCRERPAPPHEEA
jgi:hypothetical protein